MALSCFSPSSIPTATCDDNPSCPQTPDVVLSGSEGADCNGKDEKAISKEKNRP
jgi:uncharacterized Zn-binding protein involved in type VI secretion